MQVAPNFQLAKTYLNFSTLEEFFKHFSSAFAKSKDEFSTMFLIQKNLFERTSQNFKLGVYTQDEFDSSREVIRKQLAKIFEEALDIKNQAVLESQIKYKGKSKPKIFLSYTWKDENQVNEIDEQLSTWGLTLIRDKRDLKYTESLNEFMERVRKTDYVLICISDSYLKSFNCMSEVLHAMKNVNYKKRILPIVLDSKILSVNGRADYVKYWANEIKSYKEKLVDLEPENAISVSIYINGLKHIYNTIDEFLNAMSDMIYVTFDGLKADKYEKLFARIGIEKVPVTLERKKITESRQLYKRAEFAPSHADKVKLYTKALGLDDKFVDALRKRGDLFYEMRMYNESAIDYRAASELEPENSVIYNELGVVLRMVGQYSNAVKAFNKALKLDPEYYEAYSNRGLAWDNLQEFEKACSDYRKSIKINPIFKVGYNNLGFTLRKMKEYDKAIVALDEAIKIDPKYGFAYGSLAELYAIKNQRTNFLKNVELALKFGCPIGDYLDDEAYANFLKDSKFLNLLKQYPHPIHVQTRFEI